VTGSAISPSKTGSHTACNVTYDELGSILSQPTRTGSRQYTYLIDGSVRSISDGQGSVANFRCDAFGARPHQQHVDRYTTWNQSSSQVPK
jgi:hypothetical protein